MQTLRAAAGIARSRNHSIGVIGTPTTVNSDACARDVYQYDPDARIYSHARPLFVPLVEEGWLEHEVTRLTAQEYLRPGWPKAWTRRCSAVPTIPC